MSIGASEHRPFVRAKARFAGQKAQEHSFVRRNAVTPDILLCIVGGIFWRKVPRVPCPSRSPSVRPVRSHSLPEERLLPGPLRHPPLPGVSLFRRFRCYLGRPHALPGPLRLPPLPGVSRFRRIGSHLRRVTQAPRPGTMAAGALEQAASCDAFVLSRRLPAPDAPPIRTSPAGLIAKAPSNSRRTTARSRAGTAAANSVGLGQGHHRWTAFWPWAT